MDWEGLGRYFLFFLAIVLFIGAGVAHDMHLKSTAEALNTAGGWTVFFFVLSIL